MDLIYFYPSGNDSPANVGKRILENILTNPDELPFDAIKLYCSKKDLVVLQSKFKDVEVITYKDLFQISSDSLLHIPTSLIIFPNNKFLLYTFCKFIKKTKIILQYHGDLRTELCHKFKNFFPLIHILSFIFIPYILRCADAVITHSYSLKNIIQQYGVNKCVVIANAIDSYWFEPSFRELPSVEINILKDSYNVFYHGRLSWEKGVDLLIEAVAIFAKNNPNIMFYIAGEGSQRNYLESLCQKLNLSDNVVFLGNMDKGSIKYFLKQVDLAVYPSRFDNFPLSILEALSCAECPVCFSKKAGIFDFVANDGYVFHTFEPTVDELINVLNTGLLRTGSESLNTQKKFANKYQWNMIISDYIEVYNMFTLQEVSK